MVSPEIIALLCAGSSRYHPVSAKSTSQQLTKAEIAGLLHGLSESATLYALAKYAHCEDSERNLIAHIRGWAAGVAVKEGWQIVRGRPTVVNMAVIAVLENIRPNRCKICNGTGVVKVKSCSCCNGTGVKKLSGRDIAEAICVPESTYRTTWKERYNFIFMHVNDLDREIMKAINRKECA